MEQDNHIHANAHANDMTEITNEIESETPRTLENDDGKIPLQGKQEVGKLAIWTLSSYKSGCGITQLQDGNIDTYWQSDGPQPHILTLQFSRRMKFIQISFYIDISLDESYTPHKISISAGTAPHDLEELNIIELEDPKGWCHIDLHDGCAKLLDNLSDDERDMEIDKYERKPLCANVLALSILSNHQNGKDTHIRQVKIFSPEKELFKESKELPAFTSPLFKMHAFVR